MSKVKAAAAKRTGGDISPEKAKQSESKSKSKVSARKIEKIEKSNKTKTTMVKNKTPDNGDKVKTKDKKQSKSDTDIVPTSAARSGAGAARIEGKAPPAFSNAGLGIKTASRKPGLAVAPGVMILGRTTQTANEKTPRHSDRKLSRKEQQEIKQLLLERRERLLAGMRRELAIQKERAETKAADEVDKATDAYDEDLSFEIATANDQELREIQVALEKIEKGTYGECEICGCGISLSRLKIIPSATTCVHCRGQEEQTRRRDDIIPAFGIMPNEDTEADVDDM